MRELDLHGYRLHEAQEGVLKFVDKLFADGEGCGRIIHGHGVIASQLDEWLARYPFIAKVEIDAINTGATIVWIDQ